jgi:hypothetical protein
MTRALPDDYEKRFHFLAYMHDILPERIESVQSDWQDGLTLDH